jgi:thiaminase/transcriptional activator TenA
VSAAAWSEEAHAAGREEWQRILAHPVVRDLQGARLGEATLRYYVGQRRHYVDAVAKACALAAAKAPDGDTRDFCLEQGRGTDEPCGFDGDAGAEIAPTCRGYALHLLTIAYSRDTVDLLAALLPHRRIWAEIGALVEGKLETGSPGRIMRDPGGHESPLARHRAIVDRLAADLPPVRRAQLLDDYLLSLRYERRFWDMASAAERWPSDAALPA